MSIRVWRVRECFLTRADCTENCLWRTCCILCFQECWTRVDDVWQQAYADSVVLSTEYLLGGRFRVVCVKVSTLYGRSSLSFSVCCRCQENPHTGRDVWKDECGRSYFIIIVLLVVLCLQHIYFFCDEKLSKLWALPLLNIRRGVRRGVIDKAFIHLFFLRWS